MVAVRQSWDQGQEEGSRRQWPSETEPWLRCHGQGDAGGRCLWDLGTGKCSRAVGVEDLSGLKEECG